MSPFDRFRDGTVARGDRLRPGVAQRGPPISPRTHGSAIPHTQTTPATLPDPVIVAHRTLAVLGALILTAATMLFGAPGSHATDDDEAAAPTQADVTVAITDTLSPQHLTVTPGTTVTWVNRDGDEHRVEADEAAEDAGVEFDSGGLEPGERYSFTFDKAGDFTYHDDKDDENPAYFGMVMVEPDGGSGGGGGGGGTTPAPRQASVSIGDDFFRPGNVTIATGGTVTWTNGGNSPHTVTGTGGFDSGNLNGGQKYTHTFGQEGTFTYHCDYHSDMRATVTVTDGQGTPPPPPPEDNPPPDDNPPPPPSDNPPPPSGGGGGDAKTRVAVSIGDDFFRPGTVTVAKGGTVTWTNTGNSPHTVSGDALNSGNLNGGQKYSKTFTKAGTYHYVCAYHSDMHGTVKVATTSGDVPNRAPGGGGGAGGGGGGGGGGGAGGGGGGGGAGGGSTAPGSQTHTITMTTDSFSPQVVNARVGDTVVWKNTSAMPHTVTGGPLDSGNVNPGASYTEVLRQQGTISYRCEYHDGMTGTLKVAAAPPGTKLPPPSADTGVSGGSGGSTATTGGSSGSSGGGTPAPGAESYTIHLVNSAFDPQVLQARVGDEVTWVNDDPVPHNVTGGPLDSGMMMGGDEYTTVLTEEGTIEYECTLHPGMTGTIEVGPPLPGTEVPPASSSTTSGDSAESSHEHSPSAAPEEGAQNHTVDIVNFMYEPDPLEVNVGDTVTFVNKDTAPHTATAEDKSWDSGNLDQGDKWTVKLDKVGEVPYFCIYHPDMKGTLIVKPKGEDTAPAGAASDDADTASMSASQIAGFTSGWLALLAFLAGMQLQSRFASRRNSNPV
jgi:plastocyanin